MNKNVAIEKLERFKKEIEDVASKKRFSPRFKKWKRDTQIAIENIFGQDTRHIKEFDKIKYTLGVFTDSTPDYAFTEAFDRGLNNASAILESMIDEIGEYWGDDPEEKIDLITSKHKNEPISGNKVFVIHGHDKGFKEEIARFLVKINMDPIILHEQPDEGKTIIEKFEGYADVPFAVSLLSPDDVGGPKDEPDSMRARARQNVIFEFGYFIGKLGRARVVGIIKGKIEVPSDYDGVLYISFDPDGAWKFKLIKELQAAGFDVDANLALK